MTEVLLVIGEEGVQLERLTEVFGDLEASNLSQPLEVAVVVCIESAEVFLSSDFFLTVISFLLKLSIVKVG